jgi:hypothetical protein
MVLLWRDGDAFHLGRGCVAHSNIIGQLGCTRLMCDVVIFGEQRCLVRLFLIVLKL